MFKLKTVLFLFSVSMLNATFAGLENAEQIYKRDRYSSKSYPEMASELIDAGYYYSAIPLIKEYLVSIGKGKNRTLDLTLDELIDKVGIKQFEIMPYDILDRSNAPTMHYILAKKYFRNNRLDQALAELNGTIPHDNFVKPYALHLEGAIFSIQKKYSMAVDSYQSCVDLSNRLISRSSDKNKIRQLEKNRDYCIVGVARTQFGAKSYENASSSYMDLPKESQVWPEILFEEAWTSFYLRDYNRTLGKLVTYKAPVLEYIVNPEIDVLAALTYLELCLYDDAKKAVDQFYDKYQSDSQVLANVLKKHKNDYKYFYLMAKTERNGEIRGNDFIARVVSSIIKDPTFVEVYQSFELGSQELVQIESMKRGYFSSVLRSNVSAALLTQRNLIGSYVQQRLQEYLDQLNSALQGMSYIKLEVLGKKKQSLYANLVNNNDRSRGDVSNINRSSKQYFWDFIGEFWADELGDYVFSLKSECN